MEILGAELHGRVGVHVAGGDLAAGEQALQSGAALAELFDGVLGLAVDLRVERKDAAVAGVLDGAGERLDHGVAGERRVHGRQDAKVARPGSRFTRLGVDVIERVGVRELEHGLPEVLGGRRGEVGDLVEGLGGLDVVVLGLVDVVGLVEEGALDLAALEEAEQLGEALVGDDEDAVGFAF